MLRESTTVDEECSICVKPISTASGSGASGLWSGPPQAGCKKYFSPTSFVNGLCTNKFFNVAAPDDCDTICVTPIDNVTGLPSSGASGSIPAGSYPPCSSDWPYPCRGGDFPLEWEMQSPMMPGGSYPCRGFYYGTYFLGKRSSGCGLAGYDSYVRAKGFTGIICEDGLGPRFRMIMAATAAGWSIGLQFLQGAGTSIANYSASGVGLPPTCYDPIEMTYVFGSAEPGFNPPGVITVTPIRGGIF